VRGKKEALVDGSILLKAGVFFVTDTRAIFLEPSSWFCNLTAVTFCGVSLVFSVI
jgi:hypothetical protein